MFAVYLVVAIYLNSIFQLNVSTAQRARERSDGSNGKRKKKPRSYTSWKQNSVGYRKFFASIRLTCLKFYLLHFARCMRSKWTMYTDMEFNCCAANQSIVLCCAKPNSVSSCKKKYAAHCKCSLVGKIYSKNLKVDSKSQQKWICRFATGWEWNEKKLHYTKWHGVRESKDHSSWEMFFCLKNGKQTGFNGK